MMPCSLRKCSHVIGSRSHHVALEVTNQSWRRGSNYKLVWLARPRRITCTPPCSYTFVHRSSWRHMQGGGRSKCFYSQTFKGSKKKMALYRDLTARLDYAMSLTKNRQPLPKQGLHRVPTSTSSFNFQYPLVFLRSSSSSLRFFLVFALLLSFLLYLLQ